jgi:PilZ domain
MIMTGSSAASQYQPEDASRSSSRAPISLYCEVRQGTRPWQRVRLEDLSPCGFRITGLSNPTTMAPVSIRIPGMQLLSAQIRWEAGKLVGCEFSQPLHVAVFDHLVRQARDLSF